MPRVSGPFRAAMESELAADLAVKFMRLNQLVQILRVEFTLRLELALKTTTPFIDLPGSAYRTVAQAEGLQR